MTDETHISLPLPCLGKISSNSIVEDSSFLVRNHLDLSLGIKKCIFLILIFLRKFGTLRFNGSEKNQIYLSLYLYMYMYVAQKIAAGLMRLKGLRYLFAIILPAALLNKSRCTLDNVTPFCGRFCKTHRKSREIIYYSKRAGKTSLWSPTARSVSMRNMR